MTYTVACVTLVLCVVVPPALLSPAVSVELGEALLLWLAFGLVAPVLETLVFQEWIQEALLRHGANQRVRIVVSWAAFAMMHASSFTKLMLVGGVQGLFYAATYAVWRPAGRKRAFVMVLCLHLLVSNATLLAAALWLDPPAAA